MVETFINSDINPLFMPIPRSIVEQEEERIRLVTDKIRHDVFGFDKENLYSIGEIAKKLPRFTVGEITEAIGNLTKKGLLISKQYAGTTYFGEKFVRTILWSN